MKVDDDVESTGRVDVILFTSITYLSYTSITMSKRAGQAGFATKSMFDVLQNEEPEEEEVEEEDVMLDQVIE
jgi:hypothetical protein